MHICGGSDTYCTMEDLLHTVLEQWVMAWFLRKLSPSLVSSMLVALSHRQTFSYYFLTSKGGLLNSNAMTDFLIGQLKGQSLGAIIRSWPRCSDQSLNGLNQTKYVPFYLFLL